MVQGNAELNTIFVFLLVNILNHLELFSVEVGASLELTCVSITKLTTSSLKQVKSTNTCSYTTRHQRLIILITSMNAYQEKCHLHELALHIKQGITNMWQPIFLE